MNQLRHLGYLAALALAAAPLAAAPLTLAEARALAEARSGLLAAKRADARRADYAAKEAQARFFPKLTLTGSSTYMTNPPEGITIKQGAFGEAPSPGSQFPVSFPDQDYVLVKDPENTYFKFSFALEQLVFAWGKVGYAAKIAGMERELAANDEEGARRDLARDLATAYHGAVLAREGLVLLREAEGLLGEIVVDRDKGYSGGTATLQDLLGAKADLARLRSQRLRSEEALATALDALEFYTGIRSEAADLVGAPRAALPALDEAALRAAMAASSTELRGLGLRLEQARLAERIDAASKPFLPDLSLNVTMDVTGQEIPLLAGNWTDTWDLGFMFTLGGRVALFDSFASEWRVGQSRSRREAAEAGYAELARGLGLQGRRLLESARNAEAALAEKEAAEALARERARNATTAFENELLTRAEERGARVAALAAGLELLLARFELESSMLALERALGRSLPAD